MVVCDAHVFPGFLTPVLTQLFFPKPPTTFLTCFCRGERRKIVGKKSRLNRGSNSQPPGHESDMLTTEPPRQGVRKEEIAMKMFVNQNCCVFALWFSLIQGAIRRKCCILAFSPFLTMFSSLFSQDQKSGHSVEKGTVLNP